MILRRRRNKRLLLRKWSRVHFFKPGYVIGTHADLIASLELKEWATAVLDKPVQLIEDLDLDRPDPDRPFAVSTHEAVDIGGLDVLLNACKPTLLDSKPPIRLNVVQEMNPPEALVKNLKKTLGVRINAEWKGGGKQKIQGLVLPDSRGFRSFSACK